MMLRQQSNGGRIGGGPDEPPQALMRKGKPGRNKPSSRVKKQKKSGQAGFIGPRKFKDELAEDRTTRRRDQITSEVINETDDAIPLSRQVKKGINRAVAQERYENDEVPINHNRGRRIIPGIRGGRGKNNDPSQDPTGGLQSERLKRLLLLLEEKLLSQRSGVPREGDDDRYYSGTGESMNDPSYERYLNRG